MVDCFGTGGRPNWHIDLPMMCAWPPSVSVDGLQLMDRAFDPSKIRLALGVIHFAVGVQAASSQQRVTLQNMKQWGVVKPSMQENEIQEIKFRKIRGSNWPDQEQEHQPPQYCDHPHSSPYNGGYISGQLWHWEYEEVCFLWFCWQI